MIINAGAAYAANSENANARTFIIPLIVVLVCDLLMRVSIVARLRLPLLGEAFTVVILSIFMIIATVLVFVKSRFLILNSSG
jgi:hypothetical protein